jgi:ketopantoate hydroxymethyltransferase
MNKDKLDLMSDPVRLLEMTMDIMASKLAVEMAKTLKEVLNDYKIFGSDQTTMESDPRKSKEIMTEVHSRILKSEAHKDIKKMWDTTISAIQLLGETPESFGLYSALTKRILDGKVPNISFQSVQSEDQSSSSESGKS